MQFKRLIMILTLCVFAGSAALMGDQEILTPQLQKKLSETKVNDLIPIIIIMNEQYDAQNLLDQSMYLPRSEKRVFVTQELQSFAEYHQKELLTSLYDLAYNGIVTEVQPLWISNVVVCKATSEVIYDLAKRKDIAAIDYDETRKLIHYERTNNGNSKTKEITWNVTKVNADDVWALGYTGEGVIVAVIDTGVNYNHVDLADHLWTDPGYPYHGWDFRNNDNNPMDDHGHGTHCAGTVAGDGTAGSQTGVAPDAQIMCLKVMDSGGSGSESGVWNAIQFAINNGADVISMSLGWLHSWGPNRVTWRNTMINVLSAGLVASVAAGNEGNQQYIYPIPDNVRTPGDCPPPWLHPDQTLIGGTSAVICIGATNSGDGIANFSARGPVTWSSIAGFNDYPYSPGIGLIRPDIVAPGVNIKSLAYYSNYGYESGWDGTSMATPCAAGVMALMLSKNNNLTPEQISQIIEDSAYKLTTSKSNTYGSGRVDALEAINNVPLPNPILNFYPDSLDFGTVYVGFDSTLQFHIENVGGDTLRGTIVTPDGFTVATCGTRGGGKNLLSYEVACGECHTYDLIFSPTCVQCYDGNVRINVYPFAFEYLPVIAQGCTNVSNDQTPEPNLTSIEHFPNPVNSQLKISYTLHHSQTEIPISIYNIKGEYITTIFGNNGDATLNVQSFNDGVYFYNIKYQNVNYSNKFIILK